MKKGISISLTLVLITAMVHFSVATHYCCGKDVASKVSLSGELASCEMNGSEECCPVSGNNFASHCCDNVVVFYGINTNYTPSSFVVPEYFQKTFQSFATPGGFTVVSQFDLNSSHTSVRPPGLLMYANVDLSDICVFRI